MTASKRSKQRLFPAGINKGLIMSSTKLRDRFAGVDLLGVGRSAPAPTAAKPNTAVGETMGEAQTRKSQMLAENEQLKKQAEAWDGALPVRKIDPKLINPGQYANRHSSYFKTDKFLQLKNEIMESGGNVQPIKVRPHSDGTFEIIYGHCRHQACLQSGLLVNALVEEMDDLDAFIQMERENRGREDLSAWEQGVAYKRALSSGLFPSQRQLASVIGVDPSNLAKALSVANLPDEVVEAFASPTFITFRWGRELSEACKVDQESVIKRARSISAGNLSPAKVFKTLVGANLPADGRSEKDFEIEGKKGAFAKVGETKTGSLVVKFSDVLSDEKLTKLKAFLKELSLQED